MILSIFTFGFFKFTRHATISIPPVEHPSLSMIAVQIPSATPAKIADISLYPTYSPAVRFCGTKV